MAKISLIGHLSKDIELKETQSGSKFYTIDIAENKGKDKEPVFYQLSLNENYGNKIFQYLLKGTKVYIRGNLAASAYINKAGDAKCNLTIYIDELELLGQKTDKTEVQKEQATSDNHILPNSNNDAIPF